MPPPHAVVDCSSDTSCLGFSQHYNVLRPTIDKLGHDVVAIATGDARGSGRTVPQYMAARKIFTAFIMITVTICMLVKANTSLQNHAHSFSKASDGGCCRRIIFKVFELIPTHS